jgi:hypothetical protein
VATTFVLLFLLFLVLSKPTYLLACFFFRSKYITAYEAYMDDGDSSQHIIISTALSLILLQKRMTELYAFFLTSNLIHAYNCNIFHKHPRTYIYTTKIQRVSSRFTYIKLSINSGSAFCYRRESLQMRWLVVFFC